MKNYILLIIIVFCYSAKLSQAQPFPRWDSLMAQAKAYTQQKEYAKSNTCYEQLIAEVEPFDTKGFVATLKGSMALNDIHLGIDALKGQNYPLSQHHFENAIKNSRLKPDHWVYFTSNTWMGNWYRSKAMALWVEDTYLLEVATLLQTAETYYDTANSIAKRLDCQRMRAKVQKKLGQKSQAMDLLRQVINSCESDTSLSIIQGESFFDLGNIELEDEDYMSALNHLERSYEMLISHNVAYASFAASSLSRLYKYNFSDIEKANLWKRRAEQLYPYQSTDEEVRIYKSVEKNILETHDYAAAVDTMSGFIALCENRPNYPPNKLASHYKMRAITYRKWGQYSLAETDFKKAVSLYKIAGEVGKEGLPFTWYCLTLIYNQMDMPAQAMVAADNCVQTTTEYYGPWHSETMDAYSMRSNFAAFYGRRDTALNDRRKCFDIISHNIAQNFVYLTASERSAYWNKFLEETVTMFTFAHKLDEFQSEYTDELFNQQLMAKGLLLNAESALQRAVNKNPDLNISYQKIRQLRLLAEAGETSSYEAESATLEADRLERNLGDAANSLYQSMEFLKVSAKDIRAKLKPNELAIEFVDYRVGKDSVMYAALIMSSKWEHVRFLPLIEKRELESHRSNAADAVWQPIMDLAPSGVTTLYFAPTGLLYQIPIESQTLKNGKFISDVYSLYRISSTRWLAFTGDRTTGKDAVVYGGLKYDASVEDMVADARTYSHQHKEDLAANNLRWSIDSLKYLPGTETEAKEIVDVINRAAVKGLHAEAYMGLTGTEASLKALDGQQKRVIHIATHGFYQGRRSKDDADMNSALSRCGLFFAGADNTRFGTVLPQNVDDGILTAQEIAQLDFQGLDLVVLSACETGQGQISSDGVFGLQRGFKKAGANSILMSLWKVDDAATCLLMTEFYKNWTSGMSKHDALEQAKRTVRSHTEKGWDNPKYWAAFILLDGLESI